MACPYSGQGHSEELTVLLTQISLWWKNWGWKHQRSVNPSPKWKYYGQSKWILCTGKVTKIFQQGSCSKSKVVEPMSRDPGGTWVTWALGRWQRSEISALWLSWLGSSLLSLATNPLQGYGKDNKASKKMKQLFFYPCVKKKKTKTTLQDSSVNHSREKGQRQWKMV